ncbi:hypothetical protein CIG19_00920 [Enterobacterales bacterium CwR94]|nr:hypothetical protein CIG19_00920 [Enterobacterales bacterium CwR94]
MATHITLIHANQFHDPDFADFAAALNRLGIATTVQSVPDQGPTAGLEWLIPTAIIAHLSAGFFNQMGKEVYQAAKEKLAALTANTMKKPRIEPVIYAAGQDVSANNPYSRALSLSADGHQGRRFTLLLPKYTPTQDYTQITHAFLLFLENYHSGLITENAIGYQSSGALDAPVILLHYDPVTQQIAWRDHLPPDIRERLQEERP